MRQCEVGLFLPNTVRGRLLKTSSDPQEPDQNPIFEYFSWNFSRNVSIGILNLISGIKMKIVSRI